MDKVFYDGNDLTNVFIFNFGGCRAWCEVIASGKISSKYSIKQIKIDMVEIKKLITTSTYVKWPKYEVQNAQLSLLIMNVFVFVILRLFFFTYCRYNTLYFSLFSSLFIKSF